MYIPKSTFLCILFKKYAFIYISLFRNIHSKIFNFGLYVSKPLLRAFFFKIGGLDNNIEDLMSNFLMCGLKTILQITVSNTLDGYFLLIEFYFDLKKIKTSHFIFGH
jgi:hypothetical protein